MKYKKVSLKELNFRTHPHLKNIVEYWRTEDDIYEVLVDYPDKYTHLRIYRVDGRPIHNYMDLFNIKNDILGREIEAIEIYPKLSNFKDGSNTYHIWAWKELQIPNLLDLYTYNC